MEIEIKRLEIYVFSGRSRENATSKEESGDVVKRLLNDSNFST